MLQQFATAWLQGTVVAYLICLTSVQYISIIAIAAKWDYFSLKLGPIRFLDYEGRSGNTIFALTIWGNIILPALLGGLLYGLVKLLLAT